MTQELYEACKALINAMHPDHFASRLGDEGLDALDRIKAEVALIERVLARPDLLEKAKQMLEDAGVFPKEA